MDTAAYMTNENFDVLLDDYNWNVVDLRDKRYDAVIHLVTAAIGAEKFYTTENNAARSEDLNQARDLDFKVRKTEGRGKGKGKREREGREKSI
jgi:hypothetical protein